MYRNEAKDDVGLTRDGSHVFVDLELSAWIESLNTSLSTSRDDLRSVVELTCCRAGPPAPSVEDAAVAESVAWTCRQPPLNLGWVGFYAREGDSLRVLELQSRSGEWRLPPLSYAKVLERVRAPQLRRGRPESPLWLPLDEAVTEDAGQHSDVLARIWALPLVVFGRCAGLVCLTAEDARRCMEEDLLVRLIMACTPLATWLRFREEHSLSAIRHGEALRMDPVRAAGHGKVLLGRSSVTNVLFPELVGESGPFLHALALAQRWAAGCAPILITGETGTGKELLARAIHALSPRRSGPWVAVNCPAIPRELAESELFGHERGAFTGATEARVGRFERADGGVLFLDEVGDLPPSIQAKLLRVLQEGEIERVGSARARKVDVRIIAATNRDLHEAVQLGDFRKDLFHRLAALPIHLPPLRERTGDIELLTWHFLRKSQERYGKRIDGVAPGVLERLRAYDWPGNVRELEYVIERAVLLAVEPVLRVQDLADLECKQAGVGLSLHAQLRVEKVKRVEAALRQTLGNCAEAARLLGMSRGNFARLLKSLRIDPRRFRCD